MQARDAEAAAIDLIAQFMARLGVDTQGWSRGNLNGSVPQQPCSNFTDCGIYVML